MNPQGDAVRLELVRRKRSAAKLSLTPLVDCVFILLIFFMLQSNLLQPHGMNLQHTKQETDATQQAATDKPAVLYVELHADGSAWLDGVRHTDVGLRKAIASAELREIKSAIVASDPGVSLQRAVDVVEALNARGLAAVALREARQFKPAKP